MLGFLLIDKPKEITSFFVVRTLRKILNVRRIGYAGTLDPLATGLMIVAVGEATKLLNDLEQADKVYDVVISLGATSETYDAEGPIHETTYDSFNDIFRENISSIIERDFIGERQQVPPKYSAVKIGGKRAYDLVRKGKEVQIPAKKVNFYDIKILSYQFPNLECSVHCSSGTYIRSFADDLGQKLGCGAYVQELRRTKIDSYKVEDAVPLQSLTKENIGQFLIQPENFLKNWPKFELTSPEYDFLRHGGFIPNRWVESADSPVLGVYEGKTVGLLEFCENGKSVKFAKKFNFS